MKITINQGPFVDGRKMRFCISEKHCAEIGQYLWAWKISLPENLQRYFEVITVNPSVHHEKHNIITRVILSMGGDPSWKIEIELISHYSSYWGEESFDARTPENNIDLEELGEMLSKKVLWGLQSKYANYNQMCGHIGLLVESMTK